MVGVEGEIISRRDKGFPGIFISARRTAISRADILDLSKYNDNNGQSSEGAEVDELIVDALQAFGKALKVNAYDSVRVVNALYHCKYFLSSIPGSHQGPVQPSSTKTLEKSEDIHKFYKSQESNTTCADNLIERNTCA
ncbi:hypothetical protein RIF29_14818 [Crotalaria pallida]|uniref:Uncharacterized protein n=1 Tax=Crotalaria pallida TaxID=3830 RepID=A0AAN9FDZ2_CROPI